MVIKVEPVVSDLTKNNGFIRTSNFPTLKKLQSVLGLTALLEMMFYFAAFAL